MMTAVLKTITRRLSHHKKLRESIPLCTRDSLRFLAEERNAFPEFFFAGVRQLLNRGYRRLPVVQKEGLSRLIPWRAAVLDLR